MGNFYVPKRAKDVPPCFPSAEVFGRWREMDRNCNSRAREDGYCADCTPAYQLRMVAKKRCQFPETIFVIDEDGFIQGKRTGKMIPIVSKKTVTSSNMAEIGVAA